MSLRPETMIALRARHQAIEVTRDIAYPPLEMPLPLPAIPVRPREIEYPLDPPPSPPIAIEFRFEPAPPPKTKLGRFLMSDAVLAIAAIVIGCGVVLLCKFG